LRSHDAELKVYTLLLQRLLQLHGEGFGLPIVEATWHKCHVIASDIPVFEKWVEMSHVSFRASTPSSLAEAIKVMALSSEERGDDERVKVTPGAKCEWMLEISGWKESLLTMEPKIVESICQKVSSQRFRCCKRIPLIARWRLNQYVIPSVSDLSAESKGLLLLTT